MPSKADELRDKAQEKVLESNDIPGLAKFIKSDKCQNIVILLGAGVSTSAGIPDFRSPETGLYANLAKLKLPYPEAVFEVGFFRRNPVPFYTLAHEIYPGKYRPTLTHSFIKLLSDRSLLFKCFTQNIDTLERRAGVPDDKIIEAHGSFATQRCIDCKAPFDSELMKKMVFNQQIPRCERCKTGLVKPDIVFFGESLPQAFMQNITALSMADLVIVMGTSLTVHPFASLAGLPPPYCPRVLINLDKVGDFGKRSNDVILLGKCDDIVRQLCQELGWDKELDQLWEKTKYTVVHTEPEFGEDEEEEDFYEHARKNEVDVDKLAKQMAEAFTLNEEKEDADKTALNDLTSKVAEKQAGARKEGDIPKAETAKEEKEEVIQGKELPEKEKVAVIAKEEAEGKL